MESPDGTGSDANPSCGDRTTITLRLAAGSVAEARFRTFGCTAAIASASALTELATGRTVEAAAALGPADVLEALGGLPERKEACALMAIGALRAALLDARVRIGEERLGRDEPQGLRELQGRGPLRGEAATESASGPGIE